MNIIWRRAAEADLDQAFDYVLNVNPDADEDRQLAENGMAEYYDCLTADAIFSITTPTAVLVSHLYQPDQILGQ